MSKSDALRARDAWRARCVRAEETLHAIHEEMLRGPMADLQKVRRLARPPEDRRRPKVVVHKGFPVDGALLVGQPPPNTEPEDAWRFMVALTNIAAPTPRERRG